MTAPSLVEKLVMHTDSRICLVVLDGLGDIRAASNKYRTPLEAAKTPNLDALARQAAMGRMLPVDFGVTPGSGPAHLGLFGYDPREVEIGRGVLEASGMDMIMEKGDVAARANFCTMKGDTIVDRRAGRPPTERTIEMCRLLEKSIPTIEDVKVIIKPGLGHRFVVLLRGPGLVEGVTDTDPHHEGEPIAQSKPERPEAAKTARIVNAFWRKALDVLKGKEPTNGLLMRGISSRPNIADLKERFRLDAAAIATYPMYRGLASLVGMTLLDTGKTPSEEFETYLANYDKYHYFFIHIKGTDEAGEDGSFERKVSVIEQFDAALPVLLRKQPAALAVTGDHSTPCPMKLHSWHPVPLLLVGPNCGADLKPRFTEAECNSGSLGIFESRHLMALLLANAGKLDKFGA